MGKSSNSPKQPRKLRTKLLVAGGTVIGAVVIAGGLWRIRKRFIPQLPRIAVQPVQKFQMGYNLDFPGDWTNLPPFIDHFKNARGFAGVCEPVACDPIAHLDLDAQGWLKSLTFRDDPTRSYSYVESILNTTAVRSDQGKPFAVTWEGNGKLDVDDAPELSDPKLRSARLHFVPKGDYSVLRLYSTDPQATGDYVRNIRVFRQDQETLVDKGQLFNPDMLDYLSPFGSLRFMDWMHSNEMGRCSGGGRAGLDCYAGQEPSCGSGSCTMPGNFAERPLPDQAMLLHSAQFLDNAHPERGRKVGGYPLEVMLALANELKANPHFNLPAQYDEHYVQQWGELVRDKLSPLLLVTVEYSNEVWNDNFPQAEYAQKQAHARWPGEPTGAGQFFAMRTDNLCRILREVFAGQTERLRCVISPQTAWRERVADVLDCPLWVAENPDRKSCVENVDAINISGYFSGCLHSHPEMLQQWSEKGQAEALRLAFAQLEHGGKIDNCQGDALDNLDQTIASYDFFGQVAAHRGLGLTVYEGGTHFEIDDKPSVARDLLVAVTQDARMQELYRRNFEGAYRVGVASFNSWGWVAPNDTWANAESAVDRKHPKYRAIVEFARQHSEGNSPDK